jgi:levanbiose-producing levanase
MNNWQYANENKAIPSSVSDDISGEMSIVREMRLQSRGNGKYTLLSTPVADLSDHVTTETVVPTTTVTNEELDLDYHGTAYEIETDISWSQVQNLGISVGVSASGARHTDLGIWQNEEFYLNRGPSEQPGQTPNIAFSPWLQSDSPFDPNARSVHLRVFVDKGSVEVFVGDGENIHSSQVFFASGDSGIRLYADGGSATFSNMKIKEFEEITVAAERAPYYEDFESVGYDTWSTTGSAFGSGPAVGTLPYQQTVTGYLGSRLVSSYHGGDSTTGKLTSPMFTLTEPYVNFLVGGGNHPRPGTVFNDFEGFGWGTGWSGDSSFAGQGSSAGSLTGQVGTRAADTFVGGGDAATGNVTSPTFTITRDRINLRVGGGDNPWGASNPTAVNLVVDGVVHHSATGADDGTLRQVSWDVHELVGRAAYIQIVDQATSGWGHLMVDQIVFADTPTSIGGETDAQTTVNLIVNGATVRTATGENAEHLHWESWLVDDLIGQDARLEVIDNNSGSWGHVNVDEVSFDDRPAG